MPFYSPTSAKRIWTLILLATFFFPQSSYAEVTPNDVISAATSTLNKFSPLSLLTNSLLETAIDKGDSALKQRLEQTNGIIQSAIFNLNQVLKERIQDLDQKARIQRMEAIKELDNLSVNISNTLRVSIDQLNQVLSQNITGFQNALSNSFASLPIPTEPLINVSPLGLTLIANAIGPTTLYLTGSGLFKDGKQPQAWLHSGATDKTGVRLSIDAASMGLVALTIPPDIIPSSATPKTFRLSVGFYKGYFQTVWPSFPLTLCGALPRYSVRATMTASDGAFWDKRTTDQNCQGRSKSRPLGRSKRLPAERTISRDLRGSRAS